ncbi:hypothetical protein AC249_AIPGENE9319 [Exaiptasia diaphana]|nr:hypothetical protein AC249_AIPGENE9319 [Exaiptasia diaphana]
MDHIPDMAPYCCGYCWTTLCALDHIAKLRSSDADARACIIQTQQLRSTASQLHSISLRNKIADFTDYVVYNKFDFVAVTETWLKPIDDSIRSQLCPPGFKLYDRPREGKRGGGTALLHRDSLNISKGNYGQKESFEFSEWIVKSTGSCNVRVIILYRPQYSEDHKVPVNVFLDEFAHYMESLILSREDLLIVGDFNLHVEMANDVDAKKFLDLIESLGLQQHVDKPTHNSRQRIYGVGKNNMECLKLPKRLIITRS